jgi:hypothetical protein
MVIVPISWLSWDLTDLNQYMFMDFRIFDSRIVGPISWLSWDLTNIKKYWFYGF